MCAADRFSGDAAHFISVYIFRCVVVLYNTKKNKQSHIFNFSKKTLTSLAFSGDGKHLVTGEVRYAISFSKITGVIPLVHMCCPPSRSYTIYANICCRQRCSLRQQPNQKNMYHYTIMAPSKAIIFSQQRSYMQYRLGQQHR